ncbi:MAG TPA: modification methylase [Clostridiaceae bacterium]|jgi:site-specific DNA-methyltransferase (cytosine-N4-specific)|nr:modification methylase [Clostridiaceae bacterium]HBF78338.1 modification methylase [Clostridiaceae bacterium]HBN29043.1 modification methylase [Clostridiaceae bacterium]HBX47988.1 modification methylase [Clostridiaceae bacterium]HCL50082.1 modification methylase [Clostridiaceae bacterium]
MLGNIAYADYKKKSDIHGTVLYPAVMIAPIQKDILNDLISKREITSIFDPFHGSGTSLYEGLEVSDKIWLFGCDINPLANLITKVKLQGVAPSIYEDIEVLKINIRDIEINDKYSFPNIDKWFREDISADLQRIRSSIMLIENKQNRLYFWYMLCDIIRKYSNTRSSTYKLHIKKSDAIDRMVNNVISEFISSVEQNVNKFRKSSKKFKLWKCDILQKIREIDNDAFDISITSPPYGDNATTVPYGQFSMLPLYWIDKHDLELEGWELDNYSKIDSKSLGGSSKKIIINEFEYELIRPYLSKISDAKKGKVIKYFNDYFVFLRELCRVTRVYIVMTLGNRTVDRVNIDLTDISKRFLEVHNFTNIQTVKREIPKKRIPRTTSKVYNKPVNSMNYEYIIIYRKNK